MSFTDFIKNDNKSIIWGLLQEGGIFNDIPNANFENVKRLFESSILSMKPEFDIFFDKNDESLHHQIFYFSDFLWNRFS